MPHPLESRRWVAIADGLIPRFVTASEKIAKGFDKLLEFVDETRQELEGLRQYKDEVQDEADDWIEEIEQFLAHTESIEYTDTSDALDLIRNLQAFLIEKVNEGMSSV